MLGHLNLGTTLVTYQNDFDNEKFEYFMAFLIIFVKYIEILDQ